MAPKKKGKKKSAAELEAERLALEEQMRLEEEERRRIEDEERQRLEAEEAERQRLEKLHLDAEAELLTKEKAELQSMYIEHATQLAAAEVERLKERDWQQFMACTPLPDALDSKAITGFLQAMDEKSDRSLKDALVAAENMLTVMTECQEAKLMSQQLKEGGKAHELHGYVKALQRIIGARIDRASAHMLQHSDMHAVESAEPINVQMSSSTDNYKTAIWVNTVKNPRIKSIDMPELSVVLEIPKTIALASVALRIQTKPFDSFYDECTNEYAAVGGMLVADLLVLPPPCKSVKSWTLRQVTTLSKTVQRLCYPIPPAGADPATYVPTEEPPPMTVTYPLPPNLCFLDGSPKVGWWDARNNRWSEEGISSIEYKEETTSLTYQTTKLSALAVIQSRTRLLPYQSWHTRPCAGEQGGEAVLSLDVGLDAPFEFQVYEKTVRLTSPMLPCLEDLMKQRFRPRVLLDKLKQRGVFLLPEDRDAEFAQVSVKKLEVEEAMCRDVALLGDSFLVASNKWNQSVGEEECLARLHEVIDWEAGGRTEAKHVHRIFSKEKEDGPRKVIAITRRGAKGCAFVDGLESRLQYTPLPEYCTPEYEDSIYGECHASVLTLLKGTANEALQGSDLALRLAATAESISRARTVNPCFADTLAQMMIALRLFSFS